MQTTLPQNGDGINGASHDTPTRAGVGWLVTNTKKRLAAFRYIPGT